MSKFISLLEKIKKPSQNNHYGSFNFQYLPTGLGTTIGNCLRRILLSNIPGTAVWGIRVFDKNGVVKSKFTTLSGVHETTLSLIPNLKKINFRLKNVAEEQEKKYFLELTIDNKENKEYIVKAADFQPTEIEIINPETYIATIAPHSFLKIELYCRYSWGYLQAQDQEVLLKEVEDKVKDIIVLDSDYCAVKEVFFKTKPKIISIEQEKEELELIITTNGSVSAFEALLNSLKILGEIKENIIEKLLESS